MLLCHITLCKLVCDKIWICLSKWNRSSCAINSLCTYHSKAFKQESPPAWPQEDTAHAVACPKLGGKRRRCPYPVWGTPLPQTGPWTGLGIGPVTGLGVSARNEPETRGYPSPPPERTRNQRPVKSPWTRDTGIPLCGRIGICENITFPHPSNGTLH